MLGLWLETKAFTVQRVLYLYFYLYFWILFLYVFCGHSRLLPSVLVLFCSYHQSLTGSCAHTPPTIALCLTLFGTRTHPHTLFHIHTHLHTPTLHTLPTPQPLPPCRDDSHCWTCLLHWSVLCCLSTHHISLLPHL